MLKTILYLLNDIYLSGLSDFTDCPDEVLHCNECMFITNCPSLRDCVREEEINNKTPLGVGRLQNIKGYGKKHHQGRTVCKM